MGMYFAYARVSTPRQGEKGVSLIEQREAIERYARAHSLQIARWFEDRETASHQGRKDFTQMLGLLLRNRAHGVIIHKIDRSARNMQDWAEIGKLVDLGVDVHFATENVDMRTVAGRLTADIQAVTAAHYSRNLREEVKKGLYGRLKQGFYPFRAPIGYLDQGSAKPKIPDPTRAPLIAEAFHLYATGQHSLPQLAEELYDRGLRNLGGTQVTINGLATILRNPFYIGLMRIVKTCQTFQGNHEPLVSTEIFETVQDALDGKRVDRLNHNVFRYSRLARCASCGYSLIAERQKGHIYYRCHDRPFKTPAKCPLTSVREENLDAAVVNSLADVDLSDREVLFVRTTLAKKRQDVEQTRIATLQAYRLQLEQIESRLSKLVDLIVDGMVDQRLFAEKQDALLIERRRLQERLANAERGSQDILESLERTVELAKSPSILFKTASDEKKRELLKILLSNVTVCGKNIEATLALPFRLIAEREKSDDCRPYRGSCRTWEQILEDLFDEQPALAKAASRPISKDE